MRQFEILIHASTEDGKAYDLSIETAASVKAADLLTALYLMGKRVELSFKNALADKIRGNNELNIDDVALSMTAKEIQPYLDITSIDNDKTQQDEK